MTCGIGVRYSCAMGVEQYQSKWAYARCSGLTKEESDKIFFVGSGRPRKVPLHQEYCGTCPIVNFCLSYAIVHDEEGIWGGMTRDQRDSLGPEVKSRLTEEAKIQGWFEDRPSIESLVQAMIQQNARRALEAVETVDEFDLFAGPLYQSPLESDVQIPQAPYEPQVQLSMAAQHSNSCNDQHEDSSVSLFGLPSPFPYSYQSNKQLTDN